jgi:subtilase family serine protease
MLRFSALAGASLAIVLLSGCAGSGALGTPPLAQTAGKTVKYARPLRAPLGLHSIVPNLSGKAPRALCPRTTVSRHASCFAAVRMDASTVGAFPDSVNGLTPNDLSILYNYPAPNAQAGTGPVVAIVIAYDAPNAEADLATYRSYFGLPPCSSASGCFTKVGVSAPSVNGTAATADASSRRSSASSRARPDSVSPFPERPNDPEQPDSISPDPGRPTVPGSPGKRSSSDDALANPDSISPFPETSAGGWPDEADVDLETLSAVCPNCQIVLSEAASDDLVDLGAAVQAAVAGGATVVNASFGASEDPSQLFLEPLYEPWGVKLVAAAGDSGPGAFFPASATRTVAVAGTTVSVSGSSVVQSLWSGSGGGCSSLFHKQRAQPNYCGWMRSVADVAAVADPNTGIAFYDSNLGGWGIVGGTSVAAPIISGMYALSGANQNGSGAAALYQNPGDFTPVLNAGNIDGLGAPNGVAGFGAPNGVAGF